MSKYRHSMSDTPPLHLLLVDDEAAFREVIAERLTEHGFKVQQAGTGEDALERLSGFAFDILVTDLRLPGVDGRQVLDESFARYPDIIAIVISGYGTLKEAVEVTRLGAEGFITKPFPFEELLHELNVTLEKRRLRAENAYLRAQLQDKFKIDGMIGRTPIIERLFELLKTVASTTSTVLVTGETGTGKELAARAIHDAQRAIGAALRRDQLQRDSRDAARSGALRPRARRVHGRDCQSPGPRRAGESRHAVPRRSRHDEPGAAGEAAARAAVARVRARGRLADDSRRRARDRRDQLGLEEDGGGGNVPRGSVLSPQRHPGAGAGAARTARGHSAARAAFSRSARRRRRRRADASPCRRTRSRR